VEGSGGGKLESRRRKVVARVVLVSLMLLAEGRLG